MDADTAVTADAHALPLTQQQLKVLSSIYDGGITLRGISSGLKASTGSVFATLQQLIAQGLVDQVKHEGTNAYALTEAGSEVAAGL